MSFIDYEPSDPLRGGAKKPFKLVFGIAMLVGTVALGSTLAASINLNSGGPVEFGQGVTQTAACDSEIIVTPYSSFVNGDPGEFMFTRLKLEGVDTTTGSGSNEGCAGKTFTIKLYDEEGELIGTSITISVLENGDFSSLDGEVLGSGAEATNRTASFGFLSPTLSASDIFRITLESSSSAQAAESEYITTCNTGSEFSIGEQLIEGPVEAYVFLTPNCSDNDTGEYFAVLAGSIWEQFTTVAANKGQWCNDGVYHGINGTDIGDGEGNTAAWLSVYATCPNYSPMLSKISDYRTSLGDVDWFIPSKMEMLAIYKNLEEVNETRWKVNVGGGFWYMTSSEVDNNYMWTLEYESDILTEDGKMNFNRIVPVISFPAFGQP